MKKTINISLGSMSFIVEDDAYARLDSYLNQVKSHFASFADHDEIVQDIEARIAEQLQVKPGEGRIVTLPDVEAIIATMGTPEQFDGGEETKHETPHVGSAKGTRRFYRNPDDVVIAGVASGIASYFGIDPVWPRLVFFISIFFGGTGVIVYIVLWVIIPEAKTETEKMQMRGEPINIAGLQETLKERAEEFKNRDHSKVARAIGTPFRLIGTAIGKTIRFIFTVISKIIGFALMLGAAAGIAGIVFAFVNILFNLNSPYVDFPLREIAHGWAYYITIIGGLFVAFVPLLFVMLFGIRIMSGKRVFRTSVVASFIGLWLVAGIAATTAGFQIAPQVQALTATSPYFQQVSKELPVTTFTGVEIHDGDRLEVHPSDTFKVVVNGTQNDVDQTEVAVENGTLEVHHANDYHICLFCWRHGVTVFVYAPTISKIKAHDATRVTVTGLHTDSLALVLQDASRADIEVATATFTAEVHDASRLDVTGTIERLEVTVSDASRLTADSAHIDTVIVDLRDASRASFGDLASLTANLKDASRLDYRSAKQIDQHVKDASRVQQTDEQPAPATPPAAPAPAMQ